MGQYIDLILPTAITAAVGILVKALFDLFKRYMDESKAWRAALDKRFDVLMGATQTTMRATLIHNAEKYFERGWITPEERASWCDMHDRYSALGANGLIETYRHKLDGLHDRQI